MPDICSKDSSEALICFNGDVIKLKSGEVAEVVEVWGVARTWYKLKTKDNAIIYTMSADIESIIKRHSSKKRRWGN